MIFDHLRTAKKITISKPQFCRYLRENDCTRQLGKSGMRKKANFTKPEAKALSETAKSRTVQETNVNAATTDFNGEVSDEKRKRMMGE